jgi:hypothetical protein
MTARRQGARGGTGFHTSFEAASNNGSWVGLTWKNNSHFNEAGTSGSIHWSGSAPAAIRFELGRGIRAEPWTELLQLARSFR